MRIQELGDFSEIDVVIVRALRNSLAVVNDDELAQFIN